MAADYQTADRSPAEAAPTPVPTLRQHYATCIRDAAQQSVDAIVATGQRLADAKADLPHGEFEAMVREDLGWTPQTARRLMAVGRHPVLSDRTHVRDLPAAWGTLAELARMEPAALEAALASGDVRSDMRRADAARLIEQARHPWPDAERIQRDMEWVNGVLDSDHPTLDEMVAAQRIALRCQNEIATANLRLDRILGGLLAEARP